MGYSNIVALEGGQWFKYKDRSQNYNIQNFLEREAKCRLRKAIPFYKKFNFPLSD